MTNEWNVTFMCWILDQILRVTQLGFDFGSGCEEPRTVEIFLQEIQQQALPSHLKTCVKLTSEPFNSYVKTKQHVLTISSTNVLSFFSFEKRTQSRLSHSLPSSAKNGHGKLHNE